jgi:extracellular factor (EF) 3-hydroxypalmitic acid methyl ester biosynthesis protein
MIFYGGGARAQRLLDRTEMEGRLAWSVGGGGGDAVTAQAMPTAHAAWMGELRVAVERVTRLPARGPTPWLHHQALHALHGLLAGACGAAAEGTPLPELREATAAARRFCARYSRTLAHTQAWPRGYPGDFQLIERLLDADPGGKAETLEQVLESCVLQLPIVWQHRAKVAWQAQLVRRRLGLADGDSDSDGNGNGNGDGNGNGIRVLSIACGGSRDLLLLEPHELGRLSVVLSDLDPDALALSEARLGARVRRLTCIPGNALRSANRLRAAGPFDVILIGGLLDYLPERAAHTLLKQAAAMLAPGGRLGATNIATGHPWRLMLDLIADWTLIDRTHEQMSSLMSLPDVTSSITLDESRLTWLATATR